MISQTSLEAFEEILPKIGDRQTQVLRSLYILNEASNRMLSENCKLPINCITGRVNELAKNGCIFNSKIAPCLATFQREQISRNVKYWKLTNKGLKVLKFKNEVQSQ